jgi:hypothetical protein
MRQTERVTRTTPISKAPIATFLPSLGLRELPGLDPDPENLVAAGIFNFVAPSAPPSQVGRVH